MHRLAPGFASKQQCLLQLALLCLALLQAASAQSLPDPFCSVPAQPPPVLYNTRGQLVPRQLPRTGRTPPRFQSNTTLEAEGATYSWLYQQIFNQLGWAPCPLSTTPKPYPEPVGWKLVAVLNITATYGGTLKKVPVAAVLKPASRDVSRQLIVVIRGSAFNESRINFDYTQVPAPAYGEGLIHRGYKLATDELWGDDSTGFQSVLQEFIVKATTGSTTSVLIAGHSMGGGLATLLAARTQKYLAEECDINVAPTACKFLPTALRVKPYVTVVAFAACNAGSSAFAADFNRRINARLVDFAFDRTIKFLTSHFAPPEWPVPATPVSYMRVGGIVRFGHQDMPFQRNVWRKIGQGVSSIDPNAPKGAAAFQEWADAKKYTIAMGFQYARGTLYSAGAHICSYRCMLSAFVAGAKGELCLLHANAALAQGRASYCGNFPPYAIASIYPTTPSYP